jgi:hypothetical protein
MKVKFRAEKFHADVRRCMGAPRCCLPSSWLAAQLLAWGERRVLHETALVGRHSIGCEATHSPALSGMWP